MESPTYSKHGLTHKILLRPVRPTPSTKAFNPGTRPEDFIAGKPAAKTEEPPKSILPEDIPEQTKMIAYVDGSYNVHDEIWGYGAILFDATMPDARITLSGKGSHFACMRNVTGELTAAINAIQAAIAASFPRHRNLS